MEAVLKNLIINVWDREISELIKDHVAEIDLNSDKKEVSLLLDKKYAMNYLHNHRQLHHLIRWIKKTFWDEYSTILKLQAHLMKWESTEHHDEEMNIPLFIHYW